MKEYKFRTLTADEIECKATVVSNQVEIVLHCRAETCTKLLNEVVGSMNWEKEYTNNNRNCIVRIWDDDKQRMISKEDCGGGQTEIEGLKGQASNGFKRVCALGWGLGIELYSQPEIRLPMTDDNTSVDRYNQPIVIERYRVAEIEYDNKKISKVVVVDSHGDVVYPYVEKPLVDTAPQIHIPEINDEIVDVLPDNTDDYEAPDAYGEDQMEDDCDYAAIITRELARTNIRTNDILKALRIDSLDKIDDADESVILDVINRLKQRPTHVPKSKQSVSNNN